MASHITDEHGGSSIPIVTAANSLANKLNIVWRKLKPKSNALACMPSLGLWSRSRSMPTEAELCLLICSMYPNDFRIPVDDLVIYVMGLKLFEDVHGMLATRDVVIGLISIINDLKYPSKVTGEKIRLAYEKDGHYVKVLVGARDLAKLVALSYPLVFHRETVTGKWAGSSSYKDCYGLSLELKKVDEYPVKLECPKIALLHLRYREDSKSIPIDFFEKMKELRVLSLDVPSLPQSIGVLRNLMTLRLKVVKFEDTSWIGGLVNLEFLSLSTMKMTDFPREMGQLENLRLLDLRNMIISFIPPGVLSRLLKLEELYFPLSFRRWGCKPKRYDDHDEWESGKEDNYDDEERINASLTEIVSLSLNALQITVPKASSLPKKSLIFKHIRQFKIRMPNNLNYQPFGKDSMNELQLTGEACDIKESGICDLMSRTEDLSLIRVRNLKNVIFQLEDNDFLRLKRMIISECDELEYVVDTTNDIIISEVDYLFKKLECLHLSMLSNLKEICHERWKSFRWLPNLTHISIRFCHKLKYVFPLSIVRGSILKSLEILDCDEIEGIFYEDEEHDTPFTLCSIEKLDLHSLPRLISLLVNKDNHNTINGVHDDTNESLTTNKVVSNDMEGSISTFDDEDFIYTPSTPTSRAQIQESVIQHLTSGKPLSRTKDENENVIGHMKMHSAFPSKLGGKWLKNLKRLKIAYCDAVKIVFLFEENHATSKAFNSLEELELHGLRNLVHIWFRIPANITAFQNLQLLVLFECNSLYAFSSRVAKVMVQLQKIYISRCEKMEEILVEEVENEVKGNVVFPQLKLLELQHIPNLRIFFGGLSEIELPLLESFKLNQCNKMESFSYGFLSTPMLERIEINESLQSLMGDLNTTISGTSNSYTSCKENMPPRSFSFADLKIATKNFKGDKLLGEGGFGKVYKGWIDKKTFGVAPSKTGTGISVAIKRLSSEALQGFNEWQSEIKFLGRMSHPNVIKLVGYCREDRELLLVYEFMQRGSLNNHLFRRSGNSLSWDIRIKIVIGAARGLDFLHTEKNVIHRCIQTHDILLDDNYNAKISDFGLARIGPSDGDSHVSTAVFGTYGYAAPEYVATGHLYVKSDVYSFGVVLLELLTGLRVLDTNRPTGEHNLVEWLKPILPHKKKFRNMIDARIEGQYSLKAILLTAQLSLNCLQPDPKSRPSMKEVLDALEQIQAIEGKRAGRS